MANQEDIPPTMFALHLPPGPYNKTSPPQPSSLKYTNTYPTPQPSQNQYLIKVQATALCREELTWPEVLQHPHPSRTTAPIPGHDFAGIVLATPANDEHSINGPKFKVGDEVFGMLGAYSNGAAADVVVAEEIEIAMRPLNIPAAEAASIPLSALTAWQAFFKYAAAEAELLTEFSQDFDVGERKSPPPSSRAEEEKEEEQPENKKAIRVLVTNASGGVGVQALRMLRAPSLFGPHAEQFWICATCSHRNEKFVRQELGASEVLDYTKTPDLGTAFEERGWEAVDIVLDCIGGDTLRQVHAASVVRDGGVVLSIAQPVKEEWGDLGIQKRGVTSRFFIVEPDGEALGKIALLVEREELKAYVHQVFGLSEGKEAMEVVENKRVRGKVVLMVNCADR
ncbi:hypothetical protein AJ80_00814 [Polytolypa hystricis UAMH7299]|uniref:Enoyl reductase (ER) domain-containing protein n=1 Tax=Polytolypa hystricis (strain UAMH7299) TaxID=1447883 RepID=A0A2B7Z3D9_POLH7|nr:hypothetical protein AJ80_00814 [Polytolypa hystricis UAMH7299]